MSHSLAPDRASRHPASLDIGKKQMAKADVQSVDIAWGVQVGGAVGRACRVVYSSHKDAANAIGVDYAEFGKWLDGSRRPQFDKLFAVERLRQPLVVELAKLSGADVHVHVEFRKVG